MTVSRDAALPAYQQVAGDLRAAIAGGRYPAGGRLPGERELARQYGVAAMTVRHGIEVLRAEGIVVSREKRGHFVARVPAVGAADRPGAGYAEVMAALRMLREDLRQVHQRLDRLEGRAGHASPRPAEQPGGPAPEGRSRGRTAAHGAGSAFRWLCGHPQIGRGWERRSDRRRRL